MAQELRPPGYGLPNFKPDRRVRNKARKPLNPRAGMSADHLACIRKLPCLITGRMPAGEAHHLKMGTGERGAGMRSSDKWAVPLSHDEHMDLERQGAKNEWNWFEARGIANPLDLAAALWNASGDLPKMTRLVLEAKGAGK